nr:hypothetical protein [uncultured Roseateles sp.]
MMQFLEDTQVAGRFFPRGAQVTVMEAGDNALLLPDPVAHTTLCTVPAKNLARLKRFRVVLANYQVGLMDVQERWGLDADDIVSTIARSAPDCTVVALGEVGEST